jgi:ATP-dependent Lhr-like helicase
VHGYDAIMLDLLLRTGRFVWLRLLPKQSKAARPAGTLRTTLVTFVPRAELYAWLALSGRDDGCAIGGTAAAVLQRLESLGAAFFDDLWAPLGLLRSQLEDALDELAAAGRVTCDSVIGLRALIAPNPRRASASRHPRSGPTLADAGRWARLPRPSTTPPEADDPAIEVAARATLRRYGVVCRSLVENDGALPPWRVLVRCLRRLEARGEVRGGRFIAGLTGEQYALPQAVNALRETARQGDDAGFVRLSASDPLNLFDRLAGAVPSGAQGGTALLLQGGEIIASKHETDVRFHRPLDVATTLRARTALLAGDVLTRGAMQRRRRG